jgi:hypothetical protein
METRVCEGKQHDGWRMTIRLDREQPYQHHLGMVGTHRNSTSISLREGEFAPAGTPGGNGGERAIAASRAGNFESSVQFSCPPVSLHFPRNLSLPRGGEGGKGRHGEREARREGGEA